MFLETVVVAGLNCDHCIRSVTEEITELGAGVLEVDLNSGLVTLVSEEPLDPAELREAVEVAGYRLLVPALS
ncbi:MAG: heavy-metal-associated domain-containing protein [Pseudonocardia sp.]